VTALPAREYLDEAAKATGWADYRDRNWLHQIPDGALNKSLVAHARTLEEKAALAGRLAKYEPPVDPITAEVRECLVAMNEDSDPSWAAEVRNGEHDDSMMARILRIRISREKEYPLI
jgi:hypothetical protein